MITKTLLPFLAQCVRFAPDVSAHGDINVQIHLINPQIKKSPSAELYVKRDDLYRLDGDCVAALAGDSTYFFVTSPTSAKPTRVWVLGDSGIGGSVQTNVPNAQYNFTGTRHTDLWMMLGDNACNSGTDTEYTSYLCNY